MAETPHTRTANDALQRESSRAPLRARRSTHVSVRTLAVLVFLMALGYASTEAMVFGEQLLRMFVGAGR
jgi:hypothetical protein